MPRERSWGGQRGVSLTMIIERSIESRAARSPSWSRAPRRCDALTVASLTVLAASLAGCDKRAADGPEPPAPAAEVTMPWEGPPLRPVDALASPTAQSGPARNPAVQRPDAFAWELFARVNAPAPDAVNGEVVWQTWAEQSAVFVAQPDPSRPPTWNSARSEGRRTRLRPGMRRHLQARLRTGRTHAPENPCDLHDAQEVRLNQDTFDYVIDNRLWYLEGQLDAFRSGFTVNLPTSSIEVKANWAPIAEAQRAGYHTRVDATGQLYGLVALHLTSKNLPGWTWATFEHRQNPCFGAFMPPQDDFGVTASGEPSQRLLDLFEQRGMAAEVWKNYRLDGAQVAPTTLEGRPIILGNSVTELEFQTTSSCVTCHARATVGADSKGFSTGRLAVFDPDRVWQGTPQGFTGDVDPRWFYDEDFKERRFLQLDFVWSLACANPIGSLWSNCLQPDLDAAP